jgi:hypothetical protein
MQFDPDLKEGMILIRLISKANTMKENAAEVFKKGDYEEAIKLF